MRCGNLDFAGVATMSLRHPLAKAKGLGASGGGSHHWWLQRTSALMLIPLSLWFVFSVLQRISDGQQALIAWIEQPLVSLALIVYLIFMFFHGQLGLQVVVEDYVHSERLKMVSLLLVKGVMVIAGAAAIFAVLRIAL